VIKSSLTKNYFSYFAFLKSRGLTHRGKIRGSSLAVLFSYHLFPLDFLSFTVICRTFALNGDFRFVRVLSLSYTKMFLAFFFVFPLPFFPGLYHDYGFLWMYLMTISHSLYVTISFWGQLSLPFGRKGELNDDALFLLFFLKRELYLLTRDGAGLRVAMMGECNGITGSRYG